jgi:CPA1 family monovalent cation:H+ antiporter
LDIHFELEFNLLVILFLGAVVVAAAAALARKTSIPSPLILIVVGVAVSLSLPGDFTIPNTSELILEGVLPPLLFASAVAIPAKDFRRDFTAISMLAVVLVVVTALSVGALIHLLLPDVSYPVAVALGAILSPTDAVAVGIVERLGSPPRLVTILEGEALINDASALAVMTTALAAAGLSEGHVEISPAGISILAAWMVGTAIVVGLVVGFVGLWISAKCHQPALGILLSVLISFAAYIPVEALGGSGLVSSVVAGLIYGQNATKHIPVRNRISQAQAWETIEFLLEGAVFLLMGLQIRQMWEDHRGGLNDRLGTIMIAVLAGLAVLAMRGVFVAPLVKFMQVRAKLRLKGRDKIVEKLDPARSAKDSAVTKRRRRLADLDYLAGSPMTWKAGTVLTWAGMRGVVTLAAAQSLPMGTDRRPALLLIAFFVAAISLFTQAGTLPILLRVFGMAGHDPLVAARERDRIQHTLARSAAAHLNDPDLRRPSGEPYSQAAIDVVSDKFALDLNVADIDQHSQVNGEAYYESLAEIDAMHEEARELELLTVHALRHELLRARSDGVYTSHALKEALDELDAEEISVTLRRENEEQVR